MSDKPQRDILDEILDKDPAYGGQPEPDTPEAPQEEPQAVQPAQEPEKRQEEPSKRDKRASVYLYLFILFGAAFMMLLLAYFIQMRNNETTISDLRDTMNLSREELLAQIDALEEEKEQLQALLQSVSADRDRQSEKILELMEENDANAKASQSNYWKERYAEALGLLERFCAEGDWLMAAVLVEEYDSYFNPQNEHYVNTTVTLGYGVNKIQEARYFELREQVFDHSGIMALWQSYDKTDLSDLIERPEINAADSQIETISTARVLLDIFYWYSTNKNHSAAYIERVYQGDGASLEALKGGAFKKSTVELFDQVTATLIDMGLLKEAEDGTLSAVIIWE